jgi:hypothetical protein
VQFQESILFPSSLAAVLHRLHIYSPNNCASNQPHLIALARLLYTSTTTMILFLHPVTYFLVQKALTICLVAFARPYHPMRLAVLSFSLVYIYLLLPTYLDKLHYRILVSIVSGTTFSDVLSYLDLIILSQWSFENGGPVASADLSTKQISNRNEIVGMAANQATQGSNSGSSSANSHNRAVLQRLRYGYFVNSASRLIGTPHQVKNVPPYSTSHPSYTPSRTIFLFRKFCIFCACYLVLDLATSSANPLDNPVLYDPVKVPLFRRWADVDANEIVRKVVGGVGFWTASYCMIQCFMGMWAFLCVACGSDPQYWRPNFGSMSEGYTVRRFWG